VESRTDMDMTDMDIWTRGRPVGRMEAPVRVGGGRDRLVSRTGT